MQDTIDSIDDVPQRVAVGNTVNQYGHHLLDFLKDTKLCMLNGRISKCLDNFTCVSSRVRSVVDYIITPQKCLPTCKKFKVITCRDAIETFNLETCIGERCKPSDHL